jgi:hypothetical protein
MAGLQRNDRRTDVIRRLHSQPNWEADLERITRHSSTTLLEEEWPTRRPRSAAKAGLRRFERLA